MRGKTRFLGVFSILYSSTAKQCTVNLSSPLSLTPPPFEFLPFGFFQLLPYSFLCAPPSPPLRSLAGVDCGPTVPRIPNLKVGLTGEKPFQRTGSVPPHLRPQSRTTEVCGGDDEALMERVPTCLVSLKNFLFHIFLPQSQRLGRVKNFQSVDHMQLITIEVQFLSCFF